MALAAYEQRLRRLFGSRLRELRLFGSYARGEAHEDSDVDVLVLVDALTQLEIGLVAGEAAPVSTRSGLTLAPLPMASEDFALQGAQRRGLVEEIQEQGVRL